MSIREKIFIPGETYFITFTIFGWKNIFTESKYINLIYKWFSYIKENYENKIYGYVIMPNHIHCLIYVSKKSPILPKLIQNAKRFIAYQIVQFLKEDQNSKLLKYFEENAATKKGAKHKIFEDRYDSKFIENKELFLEKINYIHNNPCAKKWRLAEKPIDYPYSSASNYYCGKGIYTIDEVEF